MPFHHNNVSTNGPLNHISRSLVDRDLLNDLLNDLPNDRRSGSLVTIDSASTWTRAWSADLAGLTASVACAIHCAVMPMVVGYLPVLGLGWLSGQGFHQAMAALCSVIAISAFFPAWRKHGRLLPTTLGFIGIGLLTSDAFGCNNCCATNGITACSDPTCEVCVEADHSTAHPTDVVAHPTPDGTTANESTFANRMSRWMTPLGGIFLILAHVMNHRLACCCCRSELAERKGRLNMTAVEERRPQVSKRHLKKRRHRLEQQQATAADYDQYRALSLGAVLTLGIAVLSIPTILLAHTNPFLLIVPLIGMFAGAVTMLRIRGRQDEYTGLGCARTGLAISVFTFGIGTSLAIYTYATEVPNGYQRVSFFRPTAAS